MGKKLKRVRNSFEQIFQVIDNKKWTKLINWKKNKLFSVGLEKSNVLSVNKIMKQTKSCKKNVRLFFSQPKMQCSHRNLNAECGESI